MPTSCSIYGACRIETETTRLVAARLAVLFHTNRHRSDRRQYSATQTISLHPMTSDGLELISAARRGTEQAWRDGYQFTTAGEMLDDRTRAELLSRTLFEDSENTSKRKRLMTAIDNVNARFGKFTVVPATQGFKREWKLRAETKSSAWTTRIGDAPVARAIGIYFPASAFTLLPVQMLMRLSTKRRIFGCVTIVSRSVLLVGNPVVPTNKSMI
jgi:hypothetical protein